MGDLKHLSVHQWIRSAIPDSQQPTSPIGFLFLKLPPPPCAVLLVYIYISIIALLFVLGSLWVYDGASQPCVGSSKSKSSPTSSSSTICFPARGVPQIYQSYHRIWICITSNYSFVMFCARFWTLPIAHDICATLRQYQTMTGIFSIWHPWHPWHSFMTCPRCQAAHSAQPEGSTSSVGSMDVIHHHPQQN